MYCRDRLSSRLLLVFFQSSCDDLTIPNEDRPTRPLHRTLSLLHMDHRFKMLPKQSSSSSDLTIDLTPKTSGLPSTGVESQGSIGTDMEKLVTDEMTAIRQISAQLGHLEQLCRERVSWKEKLKNLQARLDENKGTVQSLIRENTKVSKSVS